MRRFAKARNKRLNKSKQNRRGKQGSIQRSMRSSQVNRHIMDETLESAAKTATEEITLSGQIQSFWNMVNSCFRALFFIYFILYGEGYEKSLF